MTAGHEYRRILGIIRRCTCGEWLMCGYASQQYHEQRYAPAGEHPMARQLRELGRP